MARAPTQCVRYSFGGTPLFYSAPPPASYNDDVDDVHDDQAGSSNGLVLLDGGDDSHKCAACGTRRVFELQLLPTLVNDIAMSGVACCTVDVFVCPTSCGRGGAYVEESLVLQPEL
jgi:hypothetical protein